MMLRRCLPTTDPRFQPQDDTLPNARYSVLGFSILFAKLKDRLGINLLLTCSFVRGFKQLHLPELSDRSIISLVGENFVHLLGGFGNSTSRVDGRPGRRGSGLLLY